MIIIWLLMVDNNLVGGWPTPLKNDGVKVSWDDDIPNWMESHKSHVPNHQPVIIWIITLTVTNNYGL